MKNWKKRYIFALTLFVIGIVFAISTVISMNANPSSVGPGSGLGVLAPIVGGILGYIVGGIFDIFTKSN